MICMCPPSHQYIDIFDICKVEKQQFHMTECLDFMNDTSTNITEGDTTKPPEPPKPAKPKGNKDKAKGKDKRAP